MPSFTKKAIKDAFLSLLTERPLNQITVKDVVEACGINRNSFYYHYEGLPALLEEIVEEELQRLVEKYPTIDSMPAGCDAAVEFILANRRAVLHVYNSLSRDVLERYLMEVCRYVVTAYMDAAAEGKAVSAEDREVLIRYHKCVCFGAIIDWLNGGMRDDISAFFRRAFQLKVGWESVC